MRNTDRRMFGVSSDVSAPRRPRSRSKVRLDERRRELAVAYRHGEWRHQLLVEEVLENGVGLDEQPVERLRESREFGDSPNRRQSDDVKSQRAEERRRIRLGAGLIASSQRIPAWPKARAGGEEGRLQKRPPHG